MDDVSTAIAFKLESLCRTKIRNTLVVLFVVSEKP